MTEFSISADDAGQRLDRFLRKLLRGATLGHLHKALRQGEVRVNGARAEAGARLAVGDVVELRFGAERLAQVQRSEPTAPATPGGDLAVVHRDADLLIVDKPAGLALHPGTGIREHLLGRVHALVGAGRGLSFRVAPAHRLDRDTSGLVVFGLSAAGLRGFTAALRHGAVRKLYLAVVHGVPAASGTIDLPLAIEDRGPDHRKAEVGADGVHAATHFRRVAGDRERSLLEVELDTGRTHQIRAHLAAIGHPLVGDRRYGRGDGARRLLLHAWRLSFEHPVTKAPVRVQAEPPREFTADEFVR